MPALTALLATASPSPSPGTPNDDIVNAGWLGFVFLLALIVAVVFLARSLTTQLKRVDYASVPVDPETDGPIEYEDGAAPADGTATSAPAPSSPAEAPADDPAAGPAGGATGTS